MAQPHQHIETNPHFIDPEEITHEQHLYLPPALLPRRGHAQRISLRGRQDQRPHPIQSQEERVPSLRGRQDQRPHPLQSQEERIPSRGHQDPQPQPRKTLEVRPQLQPLGPSPPEPIHGDEPHIPLHVWVPPVHHEDQRSQPQQPHRQGQQRQPLEMWVPPTSRTQGPTPKKEKKEKRRPRKETIMEPQLQDQHPRAALIKPHPESSGHHPSPGRMTPQHHDRQDQHPRAALIKPQPESSGHHPSPGRMTPQHHDRQHQEQRPHSRLFLPQDRQTKAHTWCAAVFCILFWVVIILGGLIVLIVYLVFRPRSPHFDVNSVTLNAAYLDMGYLLNADLTVLANFTNPNKKVSVDFSSMYLDLYFDNTRIATQYIPPFSAARGQSKFANIHMVTSQVKLSMRDSMLLEKQIANNRVIFAVKGMFRARSNLGTFLRYSYWLHGQCGIRVSSPPYGVLRAKKCKMTKNGF